MFDATAKVPSGLLRGNVNQYGDFDECMEIKEAQYCLAEIDVQHLWSKHLKKFKNLVHSHFLFQETFHDPKHRVPGFTMIRWGFCIPKECSNKDLEKAIHEKLHAKSHIDASMCQKSNRPIESKTFGKIIAQSIFLTFIIMIILGTVLVYFGISYNNNFCLKLLGCFNIRKNFEELWKVSNTTNEINCIHGVRGLSALALLISHKSMALLYNPYINRTDMSVSLGRQWSVIGRTAILYTECFILISGLLNAKALFTSLDRKRDMQFKHKLISRIFRILPNLLAVIIFCTYILPDIGTGPIWPIVIDHHSKLCRKYMWRNMFLIHNYFGFENMCLTHTHQLAIDMQLYMVTPIFVYLIWKHRNVGLWITGFVAVISTFLRFYVTWTNSLSHVVYFGIPISRMFQTANLSYILPTHRATIYLIGVIMAYILQYSNKKVPLSKKQKFIIWSIMYVVAFSVWFGPFKMCLLGFEYNRFMAAVYGAISPIFWGAGVAWVIYSVEGGFGSWFGPLLNWRYFKHFTKIAYSIYLVQFPVFFYNIGKTRHVDEYKPFMMIELSETLAIIFLATLLTVTVEMPFQKLRLLLFTEGKTILKKESSYANIKRRSKLG